MWFIFTLATTLLWGLAELFYKKGSHENEKYDHLRVCIMVGAVMGIHAIFTLLTSDVHYDPMNLIAYLPVSLCYIVSMACSFFGIRFIEESLADPIENTAGAMCSLLCVIFLGESISLPVWTRTEERATCVKLCAITVGKESVGGRVVVWHKVAASIYLLIDIYTPLRHPELQQASARCV